jgi:hypothetical protein
MLVWFALAKILQTLSGAKKMKTLRQTCAAITLSLVLAVSVLAGHIDTTGAPAPSPTPSASTTSTATTIALTILSLIYR